MNLIDIVIWTMKTMQRNFVKKNLIDNIIFSLLISSNKKQQHLS